ncbi:cyclase family protein [Streptomyces sp. NBC_01314]|uniref:cyclase family protein n=1 Tax=Streptomyces sp. NBC_01314 TaxID=2903821 RepID=UPI0030921787|nr:cyclase family protein [Streptomyces sp. NBC_01314]
MSEPRTTLTDLVNTFELCAVFELEHPRYVGAPIFPAHWPGFVYTLHRHHEALGAGVRTSASGTITMQEHSGTHIDALCHQAVEMQMFGGVEVTPQVQTPRGFTELGAETIAPIFRRGVLLDVPATMGVEALEPGYLVTADDLALTERTQGVVVGDGDCVLIRTGAGSSYSKPEKYLAGAGISPEAARWLAARNPYLCGADNVAFDVPENSDPELGSLPCHVVLIYEAGIYIVENLQLEDLAASGNHEFLFACLPLKLAGVTGSPVRPVALVLP